MFHMYTSRVEYWLEVIFDFEYTNDLKLEVSNFGRLRTFHKTSNGKIIKGSTVEGYAVYKGKHYKPKDPITEQKINDTKDNCNNLALHIKSLQDNNAKEEQINELIATLKKDMINLKNDIRKDTNKRAINNSLLVHRLVAEYFLPKPNVDQILVAHLDYDKKNNHASNLKWMTKEENILHQAKSPAVLERNVSTLNPFKNAKLTETKVMLIKKYIGQDRSTKMLSKQFKVSEMQIKRIKNGTNWGSVKAAD